MYCDLEFEELILGKGNIKIQLWGVLPESVQGGLYIKLVLNFRIGRYVAAYTCFRTLS